MTKRYYLIDTELLQKEIKGLVDGIEDELKKGNDFVPWAYAAAMQVRVLMATRQGVFVEHDTADDSYVIHNAVGTEEFLAEQREKGKSALRDLPNA